MNTTQAEEYAGLILKARRLKDQADAVRYRAQQLHDVVLQQMLDDLLSHCVVSCGTLLIDRKVHAAFRDGDRARSVEACACDLPELLTVDHRMADTMLRRIMDEKGGEFFDDPSDAFSEAFEPNWDIKLMLRQRR